jgi:phage baseplate assembly protein V
VFDIAELKRKLKNMARVTSIVTPNDEGKALATIKIGKNESIEFPVMSFANSFKKHWIPIRAKEQVLVVFPFGNANKGYIFRGIFNTGLKEPNGADLDTEIIEYQDGAKFSYSVKSGEMRVEGVKTLTVVVENLNVTGSTVFNSGVQMKSTLDVNGDISTKAKVNDVRGDLTNFKTTDKASRL